jgi:hypothetical protein
LLSTPNGCMCHRLDGGKICIACQSRAKATVKCKKCGVGIMGNEEVKRQECTQCYWG